MLGDLTEGSGRDSLKSKLGLLNAKDEETNGTSINYSLSKLMSVLGNACKCPCGSLLY